MNILVTEANGQLGNEMRIVSKNTTDHHISTYVNLVEGLKNTYLDGSLLAGIPWRSV